MLRPGARRLDPLPAGLVLSRPLGHPPPPPEQAPGATAHRGSWTLGGTKGVGVLPWPGAQVPPALEAVGSK